VPIGTPTSIGSATNSGGGGTTLAITTTGAVSIGDHVILGIGHEVNSAITSVVDTRSNTWQQDNTRSESTNVANVKIWSCKVTTAIQTSDTITITFTSGQTTREAHAFSVSGLASSSWLDQIGGANGFGAAPSGVTPATTQADELVFGVVRYDNAADTFTAGSGFTELTAVSTASDTTSFEYKIVAATGAQTINGTFGGNQSFALAGATYKGGSVPIEKTLTYATETDAAQALTWSKTYQSSWGDLGIEYGMMPFSGETIVDSGRRRYSLPPMSP
jgi:hypothetical protein